MWSKHQLMIVHRYRRLAALDDEEYRSLMARVTSCQARSSTCPDLDNRDFDLFLAHLETQLDWRIKEGLAKPVDASFNLFYWRNKLPRVGKVNSRQIHEIYDWWNQLQPYIPAKSRTPEYLRSIAAMASHSKIAAVTDLSARHAGLVIEALKDRLRWEAKRAAATQPALVNGQDALIDIAPLPPENDGLSDIPF